MQNALLDGLVEGGYGLAVGLSGGGFVALFEALAQVAQGGAELRCIGPVTGGALRGLTGALERRKMICHEADYLCCPRLF